MYFNEVKKAVAEFNEKKIISKKWFEFYNNILEKQDKISRNYKTRMLIFHRWFKYWEKEFN